MAMISTIENIAHRYGILPSEAMRRATTFDLVILDAVMGYQNTMREQQQKEADPSKYSPEELLKISQGLI